MCRSRPDPAAEAVTRWTWSARWQLTRFAQRSYAARGRGIIVIRTRTVPAVPPGVDSLIPQRKLTYLTPATIRRLKPTKRVTAMELRGWISSTQHYDPLKDWVGVLIIPHRPITTMYAHMTTLESEAAYHFRCAMTARPLALALVSDAARVYYDELTAAHCPAAEIEAIGRQTMAGYLDAFTRYDNAPVLGRQISDAIGEAFHIDVTDPALTARR
jgi:hypothetical protein